MGGSKTTEQQASACEYMMAGGVAVVAMGVALVVRGVAVSTWVWQ